MRSRLTRSVLTAPVIAAFALAPTGAATLLGTTRSTVAGAMALAPAALGRAPITTLVTSLRAGAKDLGSAPANDRVTALVGLRLPDQAGLTALLGHVTNPSDPAYGQYLTPEQFRARYSPDAASAEAVTAWLRSAGLTIVEVPSNRLYVAVTGTVAQAARAFATRFDRVAVGGSVVNVAVRAASAPLTLARIVTQVRGLDGGDVPHAQSLLAPPAFVNATPCSDYWSQKAATGTPLAFGAKKPLPAVPCGYTPTQLQQAYGIAPALKAGIDGTGIKVAVIDPFSNPHMQADVQTYSQKHGLPPAKFVEYTDPLAAYIPTLPGGLWNPDGASGEEALDVEAIHAMAPGATIVYQASDTLLNVTTQMAQNKVVNNRLAQIVSNSYGTTVDKQDSTDDAIFMQAGVEGIGFYFSSGDGGDETKDPKGPGDRETNASANNPWVTAVGGTSLGIGPGGQYLFETYWGTTSRTLSNGAWGAPTYLYGAGGGTSQAYAEPDYQKGVVPPAIANYWQGKPLESGAGSSTSSTAFVPGRAVPDISMVGDPNTGMLIGLTEDFTAPKNPNSQQLPLDDVHYGEYRIGGTSLSCPLFAGIMALADQAAGHAHGFVNPALYAAYRHNPGIVRDPHNPYGHRLADVRVNYNNSVDPSGGTTTILRSFDELLTLHEKPGYDDSTGLGTPLGVPFLHALAPNSATLRRLLPR